MAKRKRDLGSRNGQGHHVKRSKESKANANDLASSSGAAPTSTTTNVQIVAGSYDRVLHGIIARIRQDADPQVEFLDTFLFDAHMSAIKCLAVSPPSAPAPGQTQRVMLATGGTDERINVYNLSAHPPRQSADQKLISSLAPRPVLENPKNRELGTLLHHSSTVTKLTFPTRSKLLSSSEDSTIAVTRTRDWSLLSAIKAPIPKAQGRPSGDTAPMGGLPAGVNDFAVHPSMKLMISVGKRERCMRLWNLVTGKKAGVLNFGREVLQEIGEGKPSMGEGRKVVWGSSDGEDEFAVAFDREVLVFGMGGVPRCRVMGSTRTKVHHIQYVQLGSEEEQGGGDGSDGADEGGSYLAVATEDGRICFFSTRRRDLQFQESQSSNGQQQQDKTTSGQLPVARPTGYIGGKGSGVSSRIKDFVVLPPETEGQPLEGKPRSRGRIIVSGSSDGKLMVWHLSAVDISGNGGSGGITNPIGSLLGSYETQNRITCVTAFRMIPKPDGPMESSGDEDEEGEGEDDDDDDGSDDDG